MLPECYEETAPEEIQLEAVIGSGTVIGVTLRYVFMPCQWARIKHDVIFRRSSPDGSTSWTSDNYITTATCDRLKDGVMS